MYLSIGTSLFLLTILILPQTTSLENLNLLTTKTNKLQNASDPPLSPGTAAARKDQ